LSARQPEMERSCMPEIDGVVTVVREWVVKADSDLTAAAALLRLKDGCPTDVVCFHAQQSVEKYLKAFLVSESVDFPKTHDLERLIALLPPRSRPTLSVEDQGKLTEYATAARYPGWGPIPLSEARRAVATARRVRKHIRGLLPRGALRRRSR